MVKYIVNVTLTPTMFGVCRTFNILKTKDFFNVESISSIWNSRPEGQLFNPLSEIMNFSQYSREAIPLKTAGKLLGLEILFSDSNKASYTGSFPVIIHSAHELPTESSQRVVLSYGEAVNLLITPKLKKIDDSMIGMKPKELRITSQ